MSIPTQANEVSSHPESSLNYKSEIDPSKEINLRQWAVTAAIEMGGFHTILLVEGLDGLSERINPLHITRCYNKQGYVTVKKIPKPLNTNKYHPSHKTWVIAREKVEAMRERIYWEQEHPEESPFCIWGNKSVFSHTVTVVKTDDPILSKMQTKDPTSFQKIYNLAATRKELQNKLTQNALLVGAAIISGRAARLTMKAIHIEETGFDLHGEVIQVLFPHVWYVFGVPVMKSAVIEIFQKSFNTPKRTILTFLTAGSICFISHYIVKYAAVAARTKYHQKELKLLEDNETSIQTRILEANSCFTWARAKLTMCDVFLEESKIENLVSIPQIVETKVRPFKPPFE